MAGCIDAEIALQVRSSHPAAEIGDAIGLAVAPERAGQVIGRRGGKWNSGKVIEVGKCFSRRLDPATPLIKVERMDDLSIDNGMGGADQKIGLERIGLAFIHMDQRSALNSGREF